MWEPEAHAPSSPGLQLTQGSEASMRQPQFLLLVGNLNLDHHGLLVGGYSNKTNGSRIGVVVPALKAKVRLIGR